MCIHLPYSFKVPLNVNFNISQNINIFLQPLNRSLAEKDYKLIVSNRKHLKGLFGNLDNGWPSYSLSYSENKKALKWHEEQFLQRKSFAYAIHKNDEYVGCLYLYGKSEVGSLIKYSDDETIYAFMWTTVVNYKNGIDNLIYQKINEWLIKDWFINKIEFPGRSIPLENPIKNTAKWILVEKNNI